MKRIKVFIITAVISLGLGGLAAPVVVHATPKSVVCNALGSNDGCTTQPADNGINLDGVITAIINLMSVLVGVVSVIMIILGGFRYITSGGDTSNVTSAKNTIIYALIGLVVVALAQFIVQFVLNKVTQTS
jgi:cytochrome bd-type quinol oxidase subunit 2